MMVFKDGESTYRELRKTLDAYTRRRLEKRVGLAEKTVIRMRTGKPVRVETVEKVAKVLGVTVGSLADEV